MQNSLLRKGKTPISSMQETTEDILHFSLQGLLPRDQTLVRNSMLGTLAHLTLKQDRPYLLMEQQFTATESCVLLPLLEAYPYYCPYEVLLAGLTSGRLTEATIARCRERLQEAQEAGVWDHEMRPVRNVLSRTRFKTRAFGLEIASIVETGYMLMSGGRSSITQER